jgi:hypothetical protein
MTRKSGVESSGQRSENTPLYIGQYSSGTIYLQMLLGRPPVNQVILGKGLGK